MSCESKLRGLEAHGVQRQPGYVVVRWCTVGGGHRFRYFSQFAHLSPFGVGEWLWWIFPFHVKKPVTLRSSLCSETRSGLPVSFLCVSQLRGTLWASLVKGFLTILSYTDKRHQEKYKPVLAASSNEEETGLKKKE